MELTMTSKEFREISRRVDNGFPIINFTDGLPTYNNSIVKKVLLGYKRVSVHQIPIRIVEEEK